METLLAYITTKDKDEARRVGKELLEKRLAACVNIFEGMESHYWWEGKIESASECVLIAKTIGGNEKKLESAVRQAHSYRVPCILFLKVESGNEKYIHWLHESVKGESK